MSNTKSKHVVYEKYLACARRAQEAEEAARVASHYAWASNLQDNEVEAAAASAAMAAASAAVVEATDAWGAVVALKSPPTPDNACPGGKRHAFRGQENGRQRTMCACQDEFRYGRSPVPVPTW